MKNPIHSLLLVLAIVTTAFFTTGCPVAISHPLGKPGTEKIDGKLLGVWVATSDSADIVKMEIIKKDDYTYAVEVLESGENYMVESNNFDAWFTKLDGKSFVYSKPTDPAKDEYYLYHYSFKDKTLALEDVSLLVGGIDAVTDSETFRKEVSASLKMPDCLTARLEYEKQ